MRRPFVLTILLLGLPASASASVVETQTTCLPTVKGVVQGCNVAVTYTAAPGEANDVTVTTNGESVTINDKGAVIEPRERCTKVDDNTASCPAGTVTVRAGDLDEKGTGSAAVADRGPGNDQAFDVSTAYGGDGDDTLTGAGGFDLMNGDAGDDVLRGGANPDTLRG